MTRTIVLGVLTIFVAHASQTSQSPGLVGRWDGEGRSRGGLGVWMVLSAGGACAQTTGAMLDGTWTVTGSQLTRILVTDAGKSETQSISAAVNGRVLTETTPAGDLTLQRFGNASVGANPIVGVWSYRHPAGGVAYETYEPDGRFLFRLPIATTPCIWSVDGERLRLSVKDKVQESVWRLNGGVLELTRAGRRDRYRRERDVIPEG